MAVASGRGLTAADRALRDIDGERAAWRNLLWESVRMLHVGRPDLARRFRAAATDIERRLIALQQTQHAGMPRANGTGGRA